MARTAKTIARLRLREEPSTQSRILTVLPKGAKLKVIGQNEVWYRVEHRQKGWVHGEFIALEEQKVDPGFLTDQLDAPVSDYAPSQFLPVPSGSREARAVKTWNLYGGLLTRISDELHLKPALAAAVLAVESSGNAFSRDGRKIIRFENHKFYRYWGKDNETQFRRHFRYRDGQAWKGHQWRPRRRGAWSTFHGSQAREWEVFEFARALDERAAKLSISMGLPQIMGFNYGRIGYGSVSDMFHAFAGDAGAQVRGFFDFVQGPGTSSRMLRALQRHDLEEFAAGYNGSGQAEKYGQWIREAYDALRSMMPS